MGKLTENEMDIALGILFNAFNTIFEEELSVDLRVKRLNSFFAKDFDDAVPEVQVVFMEVLESVHGQTLDQIETLLLLAPEKFDQMIAERKAIMTPDIQSARILFNKMASVLKDDISERSKYTQEAYNNLKDDDQDLGNKIATIIKAATRKSDLPIGSLKR